MIELARVTKTFHSGASNRFTAVQDVSLAVERTRMTVLKGPSGSGKTTLLTLIGCMARPTAGRIFLRGIPASCLPGLDAGGDVEVSGLPERFLTGIRRAVFGFVFQQFNLVKGISVLENVILPACPAGEPRGALQARGHALLERLPDIALPRTKRYGTARRTPAARPASSIRRARAAASGSSSWP